MTTYVGFPNTAGTPAAISDEDNYTNGSDRTYARRWTADEAGTITGLNVYWHDTTTSDMFLIVYRQVNGSGDIDKIAQMDIGDSYTNNQWHGYETAVVYGLVCVMVYAMVCLIHHTSEWCKDHDSTQMLKMSALNLARW